MAKPNVATQTLIDWLRFTPYEKDICHNGLILTNKPGKESEFILDHLIDRLAPAGM
jgi:hypothetical protein